MFLRHLLLCRVTLGKSFLQFSAMKMAHAPPGHHSVMGRPSAGGLNFPEYVVYRGEQAYPEYLITYQIVKPEETATSAEAEGRWFPTSVTAPGTENLEASRHYCCTRIVRRVLRCVRLFLTRSEVEQGHTNCLSSSRVQRQAWGPVAVPWPGWLDSYLCCIIMRNHPWAEELYYRHPIKVVDKVLVWLLSN